MHNLWLLFYSLVEEKKKSLTDKLLKDCGAGAQKLAKAVIGLTSFDLGACGPKTSALESVQQTVKPHEHDPLTVLLIMMMIVIICMLLGVSIFIANLFYGKIFNSPVTYSHLVVWLASEILRAHQKDYLSKTLLYLSPDSLKNRHSRWVDLKK